MHKKKNLMIYSIVVIVLILGIIVIQYERPDTADATELAECLTEEGFILTGTEWCSHCQTQKSLFGDAFSLINFVDCDEDTLCSAYGVTGYPTWILPDGALEPGVHSLTQLSDLSECPYTE